MKIIFDIDGTLTDYNAFVRQTAIPYFKKQYGWDVIHPNALEIEDVFEIETRLCQLYGQANAAEQFKKVMDKFWVGSRFLKYALLTKFRPYARKTICDFRKKGYTVEFWTSRQKTTEKNTIGILARILTLLQFYVNGIFVPYKNVRFYKNDKEKLAAILKERPAIIIDDKPELIEILNENHILCMCIGGVHNEGVKNRTKSFEPDVFKDVLKKVYGSSKLEMMDNLAGSSKLYRKLLFFKKFLLNWNAETYVLNPQNLVQDYTGGIIYASNHRSTLDPLYITGYLNEEIHWVALKRFFTAEDSIFNNSKNRLLCEITKKGFKKLYFFPIERKRDNPNANNYETIKHMNTCLKVGGRIGIFPEGTTTREEDKDFNDFDPGFLVLAEQARAVIQPITVLWQKKYKQRKRIIINFGPAFIMNGRKRDEALKYFEEIQNIALEENKKVMCSAKEAEREKK